MKENLENVIFSPLAIILENKYDRPKVALRRVKEYCIQNDLSWEIKKACDIALFSGKDKEFVIEFCDSVIKNI